MWIITPIFDKEDYGPFPSLQKLVLDFVDKEK